MAIATRLIGSARSPREWIPVPEGANLFYPGHSIVTESPRQSCFERLLALNQVVPPPARLTQFFQEREPEYLIRACLRYDMVSIALDYTLTIVEEVCASHFWSLSTLNNFAVQHSCIRYEAVPNQWQAHIRCIRARCKCPTTNLPSLAIYAYRRCNRSCKRRSRSCKSS